jgi:hypothetical protein
VEILRHALDSNRVLHDVPKNMIQFIITITKDSQGGTGTVLTLKAENADLTEKHSLSQYLSEQGMSLAEDMNNSQLKRLPVLTA